MDPAHVVETFDGLGLPPPRRLRESGGVFLPRISGGADDDRRALSRPRVENRVHLFRFTRWRRSVARRQAVALDAAAARTDADDDGRRTTNREHRFAHSTQWSDASLEDMREALDFKPPLLYRGPSENWPWLCLAYPRNIHGVAPRRRRDRSPRTHRASPPRRRPVPSDSPRVALRPVLGISTRRPAASPRPVLGIFTRRVAASPRPVLGLSTRRPAAGPRHPSSEYPRVAPRRGRENHRRRSSPSPVDAGTASCWSSRY